MPFPDITNYASGALGCVINRFRQTVDNAVGERGG